MIINNFLQFLTFASGQLYIYIYRCIVGNSLIILPEIPTIPSNIIKKKSFALNNPNNHGQFLKKNKIKEITKIPAKNILHVPSALISNVPVCLYYIHMYIMYIKRCGAHNIH